MTTQVGDVREEGTNNNNNDVEIEPFTNQLKVLKVSQAIDAIDQSLNMLDKPKRKAQLVAQKFIELHTSKVAHKSTLVSALAAVGEILPAEKPPTPASAKKMLLVTTKVAATQV